MRLGMKSVISALVISSIFIALTPASAAPVELENKNPATAFNIPANTKLTSCPKMETLVFRGTDEINSIVPINDVTRRYKTTSPEASSEYIETSGWEGPILGRLIEAYAKSPNGDPASSPIVSIGTPDGYTATGFDVTPADQPKAIWDSSRVGTTAALSYMNERNENRAAGCARIKFFLVGYSQGALVARETEMLSEDVVGTYLVGDPAQKPFAFTSGDNSTGSGGSGIYRYYQAGYEALLAPDVDKFYASAPQSPLQNRMMCHTNDPFCDHHWLFGLTSLALDQAGAHTNYFLNSTEAEQEAAGLLTAVKFAQDAPPHSPVRITPVLDIKSGTGVQGSETIIAATNHKEGSTYYYDLDGDGSYESQNTSGFISQRFDSSGTKKVRVKSVDSDGEELVGEQSVYVASSSTLTEEQSDNTNPEQSVGDFTASIDTKTGKVTVALPQLAEGEKFGFRFVKTDGSGDAWSQTPDAFSDVFSENAVKFVDGKLQVQFSIPKGIEFGSYKLLMVTDQGRHGETSFEARYGGNVEAL